jgi:hypothetical protein
MDNVVLSMDNIVLCLIAKIKKNLIDVLTKCNNHIKNSIIKKTLISDTVLYEDDI